MTLVLGLLAGYPAYSSAGEREIVRRDTPQEAAVEQVARLVFLDYRLGSQVRFTVLLAPKPGMGLTVSF